MKQFEGYFEDFSSNLEFVSPSRTITEGDLANYVGITADYNQIYTSDEFARKSIYGKRILPPLMVFAVATGLYGRIQGLQDHFLAMLGQSWTFPNAACVGDTLTLVANFPKKREIRHPDRGIVTRHLKVINQRGECIVESEGDMMIGRRLS